VVALNNADMIADEEATATADRKEVASLAAPIAQHSPSVD
jgi:hypothetical protein